MKKAAEKRGLERGVQRKSVAHFCSKAANGRAPSPDTFVNVGRMGMVRAYLMKSFSEGRKSGYDVLREIWVKTGGRWKPSKGALYPMIGEMEREGLVRVVERGARGRKKYELSAKGRKEFMKLKERMIHIGQHYQALGGIFGNVFGADEELYGMMFKARHDILEKVGAGKGRKVKGIVRKFLAELERV